MSAETRASQGVTLPTPSYFNKFAATYAHDTGNTTRNVFAMTWDDINAIVPITSSSVVHDNAAGPGTAASVIVDKLSADALPEVVVSDNVPPMVEGAAASFKDYDRVTATQMDAMELPVEDGRFTHSILNFSIFTIHDPPKAMREIYRSLKPGGLAALLTWERFAVGHIVRAAQAKVRPDLPPMKIPRPEFFEEGVLADLAAECGFKREDMTLLRKTLIVKREDADGLVGFMKGPLLKSSRAGWTEEEDQRWPQVLDEAVKEEIEREGGIRFEAWIVLARK